MPLVALIHQDIGLQMNLTNPTRCCETMMLVCCCHSQHGKVTIAVFSMTDVGLKNNDIVI